MPIINSTYIVNPQQIDGRVWVTETHTDHLNKIHKYEYLVNPGVNSEVIMNNRAVELSNEFKTQELNWIEGELLNGRNPFPINSGDFNWNTRIEALQYVFSTLLQRPAKDVAHLAPLLDSVSNEEFLSSGFTLEQINALRTRANELTTLLPTIISPAFGG